MKFSLSPADYLPSPPRRKDYGIGLIGCGSIVRGAHLPAYRAWDLPVVACCDLDADAARNTAQQFAIPFHTSRLEELLDRDDVAIVDLAVHASVRRRVIEQIAAHSRKPRAILTQKPLALRWDDARAIVETCESVGIVLAVNQQQRWSPVHRALKFALDSGALGHIYSLTNINRGNQDDPNSWYVGVENFNIVDHGIHFIDLARFLLEQTPRRVKATTTRVPDQHAVTPMIYSITCEYDAAAQTMTTLHFNNIVPAPATHCYQWLADGTRGSAIVRGWDTLEIAFKDEAEAQIFTLEKPDYPVNFAAVMGELMTALSENRAPQTSGRDNLNSIRIAYAAVQSSESGEAVELASFS